MNVEGELREEALSQVTERLQLLEAGSIPSTRLSEVALPPRARVVGDWFCEADLAFVFARRGWARRGSASRWPARLRPSRASVRGPCM